MLSTEIIPDPELAARPFSPDSQSMRLAPTAREVQAAHLAASKSGVHMEVIDDPKDAATAYADYARRLNEHAVRANPPIHYGANEQRFRERAQEVVSAGGALLVLLSLNDNGFARFNTLYSQSWNSLH